MKGQKDLHRAAEMQPATKEISVGLLPRRQEKTPSVDVTLNEDVTTPGRTIRTFDELAAYLVLHEAGHIKLRHGGCSDHVSETQANDFAEANFEKVKALLTKQHH